MQSFFKEVARRSALFRARRPFSSRPAGGRGNKNTCREPFKLHGIMGGMMESSSFIPAAPCPNSILLLPPGHPQPPRQSASHSAKTEEAVMFTFSILAPGSPPKGCRTCLLPRGGAPRAVPGLRAGEPVARRPPAITETVPPRQKGNLSSRFLPLICILSDMPHPVAGNLSSEDSFHALCRRYQASCASPAAACLAAAFPEDALSYSFFLLLRF